MKILSVLMSVLLIFSLCFSANAAETAVADTYPLGDATYDGVIGAEDARLILRLVVGLEMVPALNLLYSDCDFDGIITAADSRLALRISVGLEEKQSYAFDITESKPPKCSEEGHIKAVCAITGKEACIIRDKMPHTMPQDIGCTGKGNCLICGEEVTAEITHNYVNDYDADMKICGYCGHKVPLNHVHSFNSDRKCECGQSARWIFAQDLKKYITQHGNKGDGYYYIEEYIEPMTFGIIYDNIGDIIYAFCGFAVEVEGTVLYYEFDYEIAGDIVNAYAYTEDAAMAYARGWIQPARVKEMANGDAIDLIEFEAIPELQNQAALFRQMMEAAVYSTVYWLRGYTDTVSGAYGDYIFSDFVNVK